jgi:probable phosphoglycerate mutase
MDIPLSPKGALEVKEEFSCGAGLEGIKEICSSFTLQALQTAKILAKEIDKPLRKIEGLEEVDLGWWQGLLLGDLKVRHRRTFAVWRSSALAVVPPHGEWLGDAYQRLVETLESLFLHYGKTASIAVVVPPMAYRLLLCYLRDVGPEKFWEQRGETFRWDKVKV